jgi:hypothetical protein
MALPVESEASADEFEAGEFDADELDADELDADGSVIDEISDEELAALAMAADPDVQVDSDAVPLRSGDGMFPQLLPSWYMPVPASVGGGKARKLAVVAIIASLLLINGLGLCVTYGFIQVA